MGRTARVPLTVKQVENSTKLGYTADGKQPGLNLQVAEGVNGFVRSWVFRYTSPATGKRRELGLGATRTVSLAEARALAANAEKAIASGIDPKEVRDSDKARRVTANRQRLTFEQAASQCIAARQHEWKNEKHRHQWSASLKTYAYPVFGQGALHDLMIDGIKYEKIDGVHYEMARFEQEAEKGITRYLNRLYEVKNKDRTLYDFVEYDSEVERDFAAALDVNEHVKFFCKLPSWFVVDTPVGPYNPDWAFVTQRHERLFFVRETKSTLERGKRRQQENQKTDCGKKHFETLGEDYAVVTELAEVAF